MQALPGNLAQVGGAVTQHQAVLARLILAKPDAPDYLALMVKHQVALPCPGRTGREASPPEPWPP
jgi:hypothetical protein